MPALALSDAEQLHYGESCGARVGRQPWGMAGFYPHEGLGAAGLCVASQTQRPQGLELPGAVRRECAAWHVREGSKLCRSRLYGPLVFSGSRVCCKPAANAPNLQTGLFEFAEKKTVYV